MRDPFSVLGVSATASDQEIRNAYKMLARQYDGDASKMEEINHAYDEIVMQRGGLNSSSNSSSGPEFRHAHYTYGSSNTGNSSDFLDIRDRIRSGRIEDALMLLDGMPESMRNAEWYYLKGVAQQRRGWLDYASDNFDKACAMDPHNREYAAAKERLDNSRNGGFRTARTNNSGCGCGVCDACSTLLCADCCCECCGGDLIPGC